MQPHRLGTGWRYLWRYDPPIGHRVQRQGGTPHYWPGIGEMSEGCIIWLADQFSSSVVF